MRAVGRLVSVLLTTAVAVSVLAGASEGSAGPDPYMAGVPSYRGQFADPAVMVDGGRYYAYATTTANKHLPELTSTDLVHWATRFSNVSGCPTDRMAACRFDNEAMPQVARWAIGGNGGLWAPSVAHVGSQYVAAYAIPVSRTKRCLGIATAPTPNGPFRDTSGHSLVCPAREGAIDPQVFVDPGGNPWLLWKSQGIPNHTPARLWSRRLAPAGTSFLAGSTAHELLQTALAWEKPTIENPSMVVYRGRYLLLYSANQWATARYAIGYALCKGPAGPCARPSSRPLLASTGGVAGPGGPSPFVDDQGDLRMMYAAWNTGAVGTKRRLHVADLAMDSSGRLSVTDYDVTG